MSGYICFCFPGGNKRWKRESGLTCIQVKTVGDLPTNRPWDNHKLQPRQGTPLTFLCLGWSFSQTKARRTSPEGSWREEPPRGGGPPAGSWASPGAGRAAAAAGGGAGPARAGGDGAHPETGSGSGLRRAAGRRRSPGSGGREGQRGGAGQGVYLASGEDRPEPPARHPSPCVPCPSISGLQAKPASPYEADADFSFSEGRRSSCSGRSREGPAGAGEAFPERRARAPGEEEGIWDTHCSDSS